MEILFFLLTTILLASSTVTAQLTFTARVQQFGQDADASELNFVPIQPMGRRKLPPSYYRQRGSVNGTITLTNASDKGERDLVSESANWCGASQHTEGDDQVADILGVFTVPDLTLRQGKAPPQFASAWVGIDGAACSSVLLQAGVTTVVNSNGGQSASAWWEWYPEGAYTIEGLRVKPGEWISVNITTTSPSSASIVITNIDRGYSVSLVVSNGPKLCRTDAEWILEDFEDAGKQVTLANFADLWFLDAGATTVRGKKLGIDGATMVHMVDENGTLMCSAEPFDNASFVVMSHVK